MTRYYYDDPLAAVWMAKHFGMRFVAVYTDQQMAEYDIHESEREFDWFESCLCDGWERDVEMVSDAVRYIEAASDKIYIHPDNLPFLAPQEDDGITYIENPGRSFSQRLFRRAGFWIEGFEKATGIGDVEIISRNGLAFMWPKQEEGE